MREYIKLYCINKQLIYRERGENMSYLNFTFQQKTEIIFGRGCSSEIGQLIKSYGVKKILLTLGSKSAKETGLLDKIVHQLKKEEIDYYIYDGCPSNPRNTWIDDGAKIFMEENCDFILAIGGGSVIDASKGIAMLAYNPHDDGIWHYVSGKGSFKREGKPVGVILTVAATGSETNGSFVISNEETLEKLICTDESAKPIFAICDPENTYSLNRWHTACGVSDIISHILEQYLHNDNTVDVSDNMSIGVLKAVLKWGQIVIDEPNNYDARANLMWASTIAMNGILGAGHEQNWISHMLEHAVSAIYDVSHGAGLACLMPYYLIHISDEDSVGKIDRLGEELFGLVKEGESNNSNTLKRETAEEFRKYFTSLGMPTRLDELIGDEITDENINEIAEKALPWGPMKAGGYSEFTFEDAKKVLHNSRRGIL